MKKVIFTLLCMTVAIMAQAATYYWVGGASGTWTSAASWSLTSGGTGGARSSVSPTDILIFDASSGTVTGPLVPATNETIARLTITGGADVTFGRISSGSSYLILNDNLSVQTNSTLRLGGTSTGIICIVLETSSTNSTIDGTIVVGGITIANRLSIKANTIGTTKLTFASGSTFISNSSTSAFSTTTTTTNPTTDKTVVFQSGSTFIFRSGATPYGASASSIMQLQPGSNMVYEAATATNMFNNRFIGNLIIRSGATVTEDGNPITIENITVTGNSTFNIRTSGQTPVTGNITVDAGSTFQAASGFTTSHLQMIGAGALQTIGGAGTIGTLGTLSIAADANVQLQKNLVINGQTTGTVTGKLDVQTYTLGGSANFQFRPASSVSSSANIVPTPWTGADTNVIAFANFNASNVTTGLLVGGTGIPANTYIINTNSAGGTAVLSKNCTPTGTITVTTSSNAATLITSNPGGVNASITTTGNTGSGSGTPTKNFGAGTNYIFNAATTTPFGTGYTTVVNGPGYDTTYLYNAVGDVTFNAAVTTNRNTSITGDVYFDNNNKLTVRSTDTLTIAPASLIYNAGPNSYIVTAKGSAGTGVVMRNGFSARTAFPVGTPNYFMPIDLEPYSGTADFAVSVFEGITTDGTVAGTPFSPAQKADMVDAVWTINRSTGSSATADVDVYATWDGALEGSNFTSLPDADIAIARFNSGAWTDGAFPAANNSMNTALAAFSNFSPFRVSKVSATLPISFKNITASYNNNNVNVAWQIATDDNMNNYVIERADNSLSFSQVGQVASRNAIGSATYSFIDMQPLSGNNYYRVKAVSKNGEVKYSSVVRVSISGKGGFAVLQNPVKNGKLQVSLNNLETGKYSISLVNANGQSVLAEQFAYAGGSLSKTISLPNAAKGVYNVILRNNTEVRSVRVVVE